MKRIITTAVVLVAVPLLATTVLAESASAQVRVTRDARGDGSHGAPGNTGPGIWGDIGALRVDHGPANLWLSALPAKGGRPADFYDFWIDTNPRHAGPELVASVSAETPARTVIREAPGWNRFGKVRCNVSTLKGPGNDGVVRLKIPRSCLKVHGVVPGSVRVGLRTSQEYGVADWAPKRRAFGRWTHAG